MSSEHMECSKCGGTMVLDEDHIMLVCPYCGNREALDPMTASRLESKEEAAAQKAAEAALKRKQNARNKAVGQAMSRAKKIVCGIVAAFVLLTVIGCIANMVEDKSWEAEQQQRLNSAYTWPESGLATMLPKPDQEKGYIYSATSFFEIDIPCEASSEWTDYAARLKKAGFDVDATTSSSGYTAYNKDGYRVSVYYYQYSTPAYMEVHIDEPLAPVAISWPKVGVGALLPEPPSLMGTIQSDREDSFTVVIAQMPRADFDAYCAECIAAGFNKDYNRQDTTFYGYDSNGNYQSLEYAGYNTVNIRVHAKSK